MAPIRLQSADGVLATDELNQAMYVIGPTAPADNSKGYGPGCIFVKNDPSAPALYFNLGNAAAANFDAITIP